MNGFIGPTEVSTEPLTGYRAWKAKDGYLGGPGLFSLVVHYEWKSETNLATHGGYAGDICCFNTPGKICNSCGFWAYNTPRHLSSYGVAGTVKLWGRVVVGSLGYRAEKAYPDHLIVIRNHVLDADHYARILRERYKVEVEVVNTWEEARAMMVEWATVKV